MCNILELSGIFVKFFNAWGEGGKNCWVVESYPVWNQTHTCTMVQANLWIYLDCPNIAGSKLIFPFRKINIPICALLSSKFACDASECMINSNSGFSLQKWNIMLHKFSFLRTLLALSLCIIMIGFLKFGTRLANVRWYVWSRLSLPKFFCIQIELMTVTGLFYCYHNHISVVPHHWHSHLRCNKYDLSIVLPGYPTYLNEFSSTDPTR